MSTNVNLTAWLEEQETWIRKVDQAKNDLEKATEALSTYNEYAARSIRDRLSSGQTTGDSLTDEIIVLFGLDKTKIDKILAFNKRLVEGKEILIAVHHRKCIKHVMFPQPGDENEYATSTGYIYGLLSGEKLITKRTGERPSDIEIVLPLSRYVKWGFEHDNTGLPAVGNLILSGGQWGDLHDIGSLEFITAMLNSEKPAIMLDDSDCRSPDPQVIIDDNVPGKLGSTGFTKIFMALEHGRRLAQQATPEERLAGADI